MRLGLACCGGMVGSNRYWRLLARSTETDQTRWPIEARLNHLVLLALLTSSAEGRINPPALECARMKDRGGTHWREEAI